MKYRFADLADIPKLQELMGSLFWLTDIAIGIIEADGTFLFCAGWRGACVNDGKTSCDCQAFISANLDPVSYTCRRCPTGMLHYACPIVVDGDHLASVYIGQFFIAPLMKRQSSWRRRSADWTRTNIAAGSTKFPSFRRCA